MKRLALYIFLIIIGSTVFGQSFKITLNDHNDALHLVDTSQWNVVGKNIDRYHAGWSFATRDILTNQQRKSIIQFLGNKPIDIEFDPNESITKVKEYIDNIENNGGRIDIITYYMEPKFVASDENKPRRGGSTLVTPAEMVDIQTKIGNTGRDPKKYRYRGIIRMFAQTDSVSRQWIKQYGNLTYEMGMPFEYKNQISDVVNAIEWCYQNDVNIFLMMVPAYKDSNSPFGSENPNPNYNSEYQTTVKALATMININNPQLNFVVAGYNYKYKKVPIVPEGVNNEYPNTITGVTKWLIDYRNSIQLKK